METKTCSECGRKLPLNEFNKNRNNKDGLQDRCRDCFSAYNKKRYEANREKIKTRVRKYRDENIENVFVTRMKMCEKNPNHKNANEAVSLALKTGKLVKPDHCMACGCKDTEHRIEAHHSDYSRPLDVIWVCTPCHRHLDQRRRERDGLSAPHKDRRLLTDEQVLRIRTEIKKDSEYAREFGVSSDVIRNVRTYRSYREVSPV